MAFAAAIAWLAIRTHRLVLATDWQAESAFGEWSTRRFALFAGALVVLWLLQTAITVAAMTLIANILVPPRYIATGEMRDPPMLNILWIGATASVIAYWIVARFSLILPQIAIDLHPDLRAVVNASRGNGWKLAIIVGLLPWILQWITDALYRDGATTFEVASIAVLIGVSAIVQVTALSLAYYELTRSPAPPPTPPPG